MLVHKKTMALKRRSLSMGEVQKLAMILTTNAKALQTRLQQVRAAIAHETAQIGMYVEEARESQRRIREIDQFADEVEGDLEGCECEQAQQDFEVELDDLLTEKDFEVSLLKRTHAVCALHLERRRKLLLVFAALKTELVKVKRKQQLLIVLAVRLGLVKLPGRKAWSMATSP